MVSSNIVGALSTTVGGLAWFVIGLGTVGPGGMITEGCITGRVTKPGIRGLGVVGWVIRPVIRPGTIAPGHKGTSCSGGCIIGLVWVGVAVSSDMVCPGLGIVGMLSICIIGLGWVGAAGSSDMVCPGIVG